MAGSPVRVFVSYAHKDKPFLDELVVQLKPLERTGDISVWNDRKITPGERWDARIVDELERAHILILLVSSDFLASDYCDRVEVRHALARHEQGKARVVPIIVRKSDWQDSPLAPLQALPTGGEPVSSWVDRDAAWLDVLLQLKGLLRAVLPPRKPGGEPAFARDEDPGEASRLGLSQYAAEARHADEADAHATNGEAMLSALLDALAIHDARRIEFEVGAADVDNQIDMLTSLSRFSDGYGLAARHAALSALLTVADRARHGMPPRLARTIESVTRNLLPIISLVGPAHSPVGRRALAVLREGADIGGALAYDGAKYLRDLQVVDAGARILWAVLRYARLNDLQDLRATVESEFERAIAAAQDARTGEFIDAVGWLQFQRADALAVRGDPLPKMPWDIEKKLRGA